LADHPILAAANLGLGPCWIAAFDVEAARNVLGLPAEAEPWAGRDNTALTELA